MGQFPPASGPGGADGHHGQPAEWTEAIVRSVAHLAAQLTIAQIRLRALATELQEVGAVDAAAVSTRVRALAAAEAGRYLRQNLGDALVDVIEVEALEADLIAYLEGAGEEA